MDDSGDWSDFVTSPPRHGGRSEKKTPKKGPLKVLLSMDAYQVCLEHVTTHQKEEMMGLLLGELDEAANIIRFVAPKVAKRKDKRPDRVELSPEDLSTGMKAAENLGETMNKPGLRILGWYHSHPKITVWPSHVDLNTQERYQMLDKDFIGMIFSCYGGDSCGIEVICFQTVRDSKGNPERLILPFEIVPGHPKAYGFNLQQRVAVGDILLSEEEDAFRDAYGRLEAAVNVDIASLHQVQSKLISASNMNTTAIIDNVMLPLYQVMKTELEVKNHQAFE